MNGDTKKIGILTFHRANNYGAVLQNYALTEALKKIYPEYDIKTVDYRSDYLEKPYQKNPFDIQVKNPLKKVVYTIRKIANQSRYERLTKEFEAFRNEKLSMSKFYSAADLIEHSDDFDVYITGSDQVWNDKITNADIIYSLGFESEVNHISYAASAGSTEYIGTNTLNNIKKLDAISVREEELKRYLEEKGIVDVTLVVDPVFLLSKDEWNSVLEREKLVKEKYVFTYSVSEMTGEVVKAAKLIANENSLKIVHLDHSLTYGIAGKLAYGVSPLEFVRLIRDAEFVIASSFHAVAFSIIFGKKFAVIPTRKTATRIEHLLDIAGLNNNLFNSFDEFIKGRKNIAGKNVNGLNTQIMQSKKFLKAYLS